MSDPTSETFSLPDLGEGLREAEVVSWHVSPGDRVVADQPLVTVETDKAVVDIPSPRSGVVEACLAEPGDVVEVGQALMRFAVSGERTDSGAVVGELPSAPAPVQAPIHDQDRPSSSPSAAVHASPRARQRARELGIPLAGIAGSGPDGVIQVADVESAGAGGNERLSGVRRMMARRMADADARVVRATVTGEADISLWPQHGSPIIRLLRAVGAAVEAAPRMNAWFDDEVATISLQSSVHVGVAMETADGLFVPVLESVNGKSLEDLAAELARLRAAVESRTIGPEKLRGQTISLSNFGAVGGLHAEMVVVPPQVAIVGAGRAFPRLVLREGEPAEARILPLSVTFDHRVITGVEACSYLMALIADLELAS
jgi:pyruvate dehydrogenase E2 component (dihydrolipoamide acetyltransferase)